MNVRQDAPLFRQQAEAIDEYIPKQYSSIVRHYLPHLTKSHIQTVKKGKVVDWEVHCVLAFIAGVKTQLPKDLEIQLPRGIDLKDVLELKQEQIFKKIA